jgi:WD40 repeat protein
MAKFRPDAAQVLLIDRSGWTSVWSLNPFSSVFESNDLVPNVGAAYSSDNRLLATVQEDGRVTICDAQAPADGPLLSYAGTTTTKVAALALGVASSPMAVGGAQNNRNLVRMLATDVRKSLGIMSFRPPRQTDIANESARDAAAARITGLAYSADGRLLVAGSSDGTARLWEFPS